MRILRVITSMDPTSGGPCQGIRNSIPELLKLGVRNEVVSLDNPSAAFLGKDPFPIFALGPGKSAWAYSDKLLPWLINNLSFYDCVIVHGLWLYNGYAVQKAVKRLEKVQLSYSIYKKKIPSVFVMPHGMLDPYFQKDKTRKLKALRNWIYWKLVESKLINKAAGVLFTCSEELRLARTSFRPYFPKREINVGYGIAKPPAFLPAMKEAFREKCPDLGQDSYLLFLSRIHEKKGVDLLINAYVKILNELKEKGGKIPKLVIAGPGLETPFGQRMKQIVFENPDLSSAVLFTGMLSGNAKWGAFYGCDAFILPSHQENFGIAVVEALACGKPVLISNKVNIWREIQAGECGIVEDDTFNGTVSLLQKWNLYTNVDKQKFENQAHNIYQLHFAVTAASKELMLSLA